MKKHLGAFEVYGMLISTARISTSRVSTTLRWEMIKNPVGTRSEPGR